MGRINKSKEYVQKSQAGANRLLRIIYCNFKRRVTSNLGNAAHYCIAKYPFESRVPAINCLYLP